MTTAPQRAVGRWARCGDALWYRTTGGTVVLPGGGRAAVSLSDVEQAVWALTAEPVTTETLAASVDAGPMRAALADLAARGVVREVG